MIETDKSRNLKFGKIAGIILDNLKKHISKERVVIAHERTFNFSVLKAVNLYSFEYPIFFPPGSFLNN